MTQPRVSVWILGDQLLLEHPALQAAAALTDRAHIRVVLLTARGQARDREVGRDAGADEYLVKPFSPLQLIETIERLLVAG